MDEAFSFRYRFSLSDRTGLPIESSRFTLFSSGANPDVYLSTVDAQTPINKAKELVLRSDGWLNEEEARGAGKRFADRLKLCLVKNRVGVRPDNSILKGGYFLSHLATVSEKVGAQVLNDEYGITTFQSIPPPQFLGMPKAIFTRRPSTENVVEAFHRLCEISFELTTVERIAIDLFNTAYLMPTNATRTISLVMAVEALIEQEDRPEPAVSVVNNFIKEIRNSDKLDTKTKDNLMSSLGFLKKESIKSSGMMLSEVRLKERKYLEMLAPEFFSYCYDLRSRLVHGSAAPPTDDELGGCLQPLEMFVSDLITQKFIN